MWTRFCAVAACCVAALCAQLFDAGQYSIRQGGAATLRFYAVQCSTLSITSLTWAGASGVYTRHWGLALAGHLFRAVVVQAVGAEGGAVQAGLVGGGAGRVWLPSLTRVMTLLLLAAPHAPRLAAGCSSGAGWPGDAGSGTSKMRQVVKPGRYRRFVCEQNERGEVSVKACM
jgi:hypothetical protein